MRRLRFALAISVVLNLFLVGGLAGGAAWLRRERPMIAAGSLRIVGAELPRAERHAFRAALREARASAHDALDAGRAARVRAAALLRSPSPDRAALLAALAEARAADAMVRATVETRAAAFAAALPAASRIRLADAMERRARAGQGRR